MGNKESNLEGSIPRELIHECIKKCGNDKEYLKNLNERFMTLNRIDPDDIMAGDPLLAKKNQVPKLIDSEVEIEKLALIPEL